jgi:hypothetical protein
LLYFATPTPRLTPGWLSHRCVTIFRHTHGRLPVSDESHPQMHGSSARAHGPFREVPVSSMPTVLIPEHFQIISTLRPSPPRTCGLHPLHQDQSRYSKHMNYNADYYSQKKVGLDVLTLLQNQRHRKQCGAGKYCTAMASLPSTVDYRTGALEAEKLRWILTLPRNDPSFVSENASPVKLRLIHRFHMQAVIVVS